MRTHYVIASLLLATSIAAAQSADGRLASFRTEDASAPDFTLHIVKLGKTPTTLSKTKIAYDGKETWLDAHTLAVASVDIEKNTYKLQYFVDGVLDAKRTLDGKLEFPKPKKGTISYSAGYRGTKGELFLRACVESGEGNDGCGSYVWTRIDAGKPNALKAAPKGAVPFDQDAEKDPKVKAPKDISVKLTKVASGDNPKKKIVAVECKSGATTTVFSTESKQIRDNGETFTAKTISWLSVDPPIYSVTGPHSNPVGWASTATYYFRACSEQFIGTFSWHGNGMWSEWSPVEPVSDINVYVGKDKLATFKGGSFLAAPLK